MITSKTKLTIAAYNKNAENYTSKFENFAVYKKKITEFQKKFVPKGANILDLGCGPGQNIQIMRIADPGCTCTGIDLSSEFIHIAKQQNPGTILIEKDLRNFRADRKFDIIIASFCIVHLTNDETKTLIKEISKSLTEKGHLYLSFMEGSKSGFEITSFSKEEIYFNYYSENDIVHILKKFNLKPLEINREDYQEKDGSITTDIFIFASKILKKRV